MAGAKVLRHLAGLRNGQKAGFAGSWAREEDRGQGPACETMECEFYFLEREAARGCLLGREAACVRSFVHSGPPRSRTEGQPQPEFGGHCPFPALPSNPSRSCPSLTPPAPVPTPGQAASPSRRACRFRVHVEPRGPAPPARGGGRVCTRLHPERARPGPLLTTVPLQLPTPSRTQPLVVLGRGARAVYPEGKLLGCRY